MLKKIIREENYLPIVIRKMKEDLVKEIELSENVTANLEGNILKIKGPQGEVQREFLHPKMDINVEGNKVVLKVIKGTKREKTILGSFQSHIRNMVSGVQKNHQYKLKICSGHFPMNVSVSGQELIIKNFLGESVPRKINLLSGADVKVNGDEIIVTSADKELAGQMASRIEKACKITQRDRRIFQDGCYITEKSGKSI